MKQQHHIIEIDAHAAFEKIGVNLDLSPIGGQSVAALKARLLGSITQELLLGSMMDAAKRPKAKRGQSKSDAPEESKPEGTVA